MHTGRITSTPRVLNSVDEDGRRVAIAEGQALIDLAFKASRTPGAMQRLG